jgi:hypothetical protein
MKKALMVLLVFLMLLGVLGFFYIQSLEKVNKEFQDSEPRRFAIEKARGNSVLQEAIGSLIQVDSTEKSPKRQGQLRLNLSANGLEFAPNAVDMEILLVGKNGKAKLFVIAEKEDNGWVYDRLEVVVEEPPVTINLKDEN